MGTGQITRLYRRCPMQAATIAFQRKVDIADGVCAGLASVTRWTGVRELAERPIGGTAVVRASA